MSTTITPAKPKRELPPLMQLTDAAAERLRKLYEGAEGQAAAHLREHARLFRHVLRHDLGRSSRPAG